MEFKKGKVGKNAMLSTINCFYQTRDKPGIEGRGFQHLVFNKVTFVELGYDRIKKV